MMSDYISASITASIDVKVRILRDSEIHRQIQQISEIIREALVKGNKVIFAGNGGSAADSQHLAAEFVSRFEFDREALAGLALTTDTSSITAIGNDYGYENVFCRQLGAVGSEGDIFVGITTSGVSENILKCLEVCKLRKIHSVLLTSTKAKNNSEWNSIIRVPDDQTARIQESHILIGHIICGLVEKGIYQND